MPNTYAFQTGRIAEAATPGISKLAAALASGADAYDKGRKSEEERQARMAQAISSAELNLAKAAKSDQEAALSTPAERMRRAMLASGVPMNAQSDVSQFLDTGRIDRYQLEPGQAGPTLPAPAWAEPSQMSKLAQRLAALSAVAAGEAKDANDYFKGRDQQFTTDMKADALGGQLPPEKTAMVLALEKASPLYHMDSSGAVLSNYGGAVDTNNPMAKSTTTLRAAQAGQARSAADLSNARASSVRQDAAESRGPGGMKAPQGYRWTPGGAMEFIPGGPADPAVLRGKKVTPQLPATALKMQQEAADAIGSANAVNADLSALHAQIARGELDLSPRSRAAAFVRNNIGMSDENSRNLASFTATLERLRNESLRLNKGVQTEGDAQRAWNELISSVNDPELVKQRLREVVNINRRAMQLHKLSIDQIRANYGADPMEPGQINALPAAVGGAPDLAAAAAAELARRQRGGK